MTEPEQPVVVPEDSVSSPVLRARLAFDALIQQFGSRGALEAIAAVRAALPVEGQPVAVPLRAALEHLWMVRAEDDGRTPVSQSRKMNAALDAVERAALAVEAVRPNGDVPAEWVPPPRLEFDGDYPRLPGETDTRPQADGKAINVRGAVEAVRPETDIDESLDAAWNEAVAALPEGCDLALHKLVLDGWAEAVAGEISVEAESPTAALQVLAERLRGERP